VAPAGLDRFAGADGGGSGAGCNALGLVAFGNRIA
jgi:hypothetical protein